MSDKTEIVEVECHFCGKKTNKTFHRYKEALKNKWDFYCSRKCLGSSKKTSLDLKCKKCQKSIIVTKGRYLKSQTKNFFCSKNCSASFNNKCRGARTEVERKNISKGLAKHRNRKWEYLCKKNCAICGKEFKPNSKNNICCSLQCGQIYQFGSLPYTKEDVIHGILNKFEELSMTPQKRACSSRLKSAAIRLFGTWNKAVKECGLKPNPSKYQKVRLRCKDGHMSDSISEKIIDDWLYGNNIQHERSKPYPSSNMDCDFYFPEHDIWVEYFGLLGQVESYDASVIIKREIIKRHSLNFIELEPSVLYPHNRLGEVFKRLL